MLKYLYACSCETIKSVFKANWIFDVFTVLLQDLNLYLCNGIQMKGLALPLIKYGILRAQD